MKLLHSTLSPLIRTDMQARAAGDNHSENLSVSEGYFFDIFGRKKMRWDFRVLYDYSREKGQTQFFAKKCDET